jgi:hypothetical protein
MPKILRVLPFILAAYVIIAGVGIEAVNSAGAQGGFLQQYYAEYYGEAGEPQGSLEWRTPEGYAFQKLALIVGIWVYPASVIGAA